MSRDDLVLVGRAAFAAIFLAAAPRHFTAEAAEHAAGRGVPLAAWLVPIAGVVLVVGALGVLLGYRARAAGWLLAGFLVVVTPTMHAFWRLGDAAEIHVQQAMFMKNVSMLGAALLVAAFGAGARSLDAWRARPVAAEGGAGGALG